MNPLLKTARIRLSIVHQQKKTITVVKKRTYNVPTVTCFRVNRISLFRYCDKNLILRCYHCATIRSNLIGTVLLILAITFVWERGWVISKLYDACNTKITIRNGVGIAYLPMESCYIKTYRNLSIKWCTWFILLKYCLHTFSQKSTMFRYWCACKRNWFLAISLKLRPVIMRSVLFERLYEAGCSNARFSLSSLDCYLKIHYEK